MQDLRQEEAQLNSTRVDLMVQREALMVEEVELNAMIRKLRSEIASRDEKNLSESERKALMDLSINNELA